MTDASFSLMRFKSPGPVADAWANDTTRTSFIMGPVGSGKTTTAIFKRFRHAVRMPRCTDGIIRCKGIVVRDSFRTLEKTTLASWRQWFPADFPESEWVGGNDRPAVHTVRMRTRRGVVEVVTEFAALGSHRIEDVLRGWEGSFEWMNEADLMDISAKVYLASRLRPFQGGLLPDPAKRETMPRQLIGDINAPDTDSWIYSEFVAEAVRVSNGWANAATGHRLFVQPSGMSEAAENKANLNSDYYQKMVDENKARQWWVDKFVHNKFGASRDGKPVYECFDENRHVAGSELTPDPNLPVYLGLDAGLTPAAVFIQPMPTGEVRVLDELVPGHGFGPRRFGEMLLDLIARRYERVPKIIAYADPASAYGADTEGGELSWLETVSQILGIPVLVPAGGSNELSLRLEAVTGLLMTTIDGTKPGLVVSPHCRMIRKGFASHYRFAKQGQNDNRWQAVPEKNEFSHPHDALQYAVLGWRGRAGVIGEAARRGRLGGGSPSSGWNKPRAGGFDVHRI